LEEWFERQIVNPKHEKFGQALKPSWKMSVATNLAHGRRQLGVAAMNMRRRAEAEPLQLPLQQHRKEM
jgi:hypothetical protein